MKTVLSLLENYLNGLDNEEQTIEALNRIKLFYISAVRLKMNRSIVCCG